MYNLFMIIGIIVCAFSVYGNIKKSQDENRPMSSGERNEVIFFAICGAFCLVGLFS